MYTDDKNAQVVLALLKKHGIKKIVVSPGMTNVPISRSVQVDPWFEVYSVVDERSAAYFACGLAYQSGEPVVISCTGATASRNYLPGLTEAYYRNLPVIALTSQRQTSDYGNLVPQITDRTISQNDVKKISVALPKIKDDEDFERCVLSVNKALIEAVIRGGGPVHINLPMEKVTFETKELPEVRKIEYIDSKTLFNKRDEYTKILDDRKIALFIGAHKKFDDDTQQAINQFVEARNVAVIVDQTSNYKGKNAILLAQVADLIQSQNLPSLIIDMGSITGEYSVGWLGGIQTWRLSEDGKIHDRFHNQTLLYDGSEREFFEILNKKKPVRVVKYYDVLKEEVSKIKYPEVPLSNTHISKRLAENIPKNAILHLGILNSLRNMNLYRLDSSIDSSSNVGGFGIDGPISTLIGQMMSAEEKQLAFCLVGDLAAFYDMNSLGIRHVDSRLRILLVNNNGGVEFRLNISLEEQLADETNEFISATGHNGSMEHWARSMGFDYMSAKNKNDFDNQIKHFCSPKIDKFSGPVLFEVFTNTLDEQKGLEIIRDANKKESTDMNPSEESSNQEGNFFNKISKKLKNR